MYRRSRSAVYVVELIRNLVAHGDARVGKWRGNWRMEWVASTLMPPPNMAYPALLKLMRTPRLPAVDWTDAPTDLNGLVCFGERRNLVSARVPSLSARAIPTVQEAGRISGPAWMGPESLAHSGLDPPKHPAYSESLYLLHYGGRHWVVLLVTSTSNC